MNGCVMLALLLLTGSRVFAQANYVLNPDFEQHTQCPQGFDEITFAKHWSGLDSFGMNSCIPDYCHVCAHVNSGVVVPRGLKYFQHPKSGLGFAEVVFFSGDTSLPTLQRDYLQGRLHKKLSAGQSYCVSFYVNLCNGSKYAIKELSAYLDDGIIDTTKNCGLPQTKYTPQITNTGGIMVDTAAWVKVEGAFVANGTERFITIGNFRANAQTTYMRLPYNGHNGFDTMAIYLVEDVSVIESNLSANAGPDTHVGFGDSVYIGRPREVGLDCSWNVLGSSTVIGTGAGIWVKPSATTSYVVTRTLCGNVKKDTVRVEVWAAGVHSVNGQAQQYMLSPNPSDGLVNLSQRVLDNLPVHLEVLTVMGRRVFTATITFKDGRAAVNLPDIAAGMYYLHLNDAAGNAYALKFVKQ